MLALTYHMNVEHDIYMYITLHLEITEQFMQTAFSCASLQSYLLQSPETYCRQPSDICRLQNL